MGEIINSKIRKKDKIVGDGKERRRGVSQHEHLKVCVHVSVCLCEEKT